MNRFLLIFAASLLINGLSAQSFQLFQHYDSLAAAPSYTFNVAANDPTVEYEFIVRNVSSNNITTKVRRTITSLTTGHDIYFCYGMTCYTPATGVSNTVTINAGQELPDASGLTYGIKTQFDNGGMIGSSSVKYQVFDSNNTTDTATVYITYNVTAVGITSYNKNVIQTLHYPNPAKETLTIRFQSEDTDASVLKVYTLTGEVAKTLFVNTKNSIQLDLSGFSNGLYFYTISQGNITSRPRKFVVNR